MSCLEAVNQSNIVKIGFFKIIIKQSVCLCKPKVCLGLWAPSKKLRVIANGDDLMFMHFCSFTHRWHHNTGTETLREKSLSNNPQNHKGDIFLLFYCWTFSTEWGKKLAYYLCIEKKSSPLHYTHTLLETWHS